MELEIIKPKEVISAEDVIKRLKQKQTKVIYRPELKKHRKT